MIAACSMCLLLSQQSLGLSIGGNWSAAAQFAHCEDSFFFSFAAQISDYGKRLFSVPSYRSHSLCRNIDPFITNLKEKALYFLAVAHSKEIRIAHSMEICFNDRCDCLTRCMHFEMNWWTNKSLSLNNETLRTNTVSMMPLICVFFPIPTRHKLFNISFSFPHLVSFQMIPKTRFTLFCETLSIQNVNVNSLSFDQWNNTNFCKGV